MCNKANSFNTNMRQFDAKKHFFALVGQTVQIIQKKMIFFQNKIGVLETELQLKIKSIKFRQLKLCASHKGIVAATFQSVNVNVIFLIQKSFRQLQSPQLQNQPSIPGFPPFLAKICTTTPPPPPTSPPPLQPFFKNLIQTMGIILSQLW